MKENMKHLRDPKFWASVCAWMVVVSIVVLWPIGIYKNWAISEIGAIIGAIAGPFAGLAGFLYIYASFIESKIQSKRHEDVQILNQYLSGLDKVRSEIFFVAKHVPEDPGIFMGATKSVGDDAFKSLGEYLRIFFDHRLREKNPEAFKASTGRKLFYKEEVSWENLEFENAKTLVIAVAGDIFFGQYFKIFNSLIKHIRISELKEFLPIVESSFKTYEKRFLYHYCPLILPVEDVIFLKKERFLYTISKKHWSEIFKVIYWDYPKFDKSTYKKDEELIVLEF